MKNEKLIKTAGILDRIVKICSGFFKAFVIVMLIFSVLVLVFGEKMFSDGTLTAEFGFVKLYLSQQYQAITSMVKAYTIVSLLCGAVSCAILSYVCTLLRQILAPMKEGRPFEKRIPSDIRKIAWATLIGGAINETLKLIEQLFVVKALPMDAIFASSAVGEKVYNFNFDTNFVFVFFLMMFLSYIFAYGQSLQQEADETV